MRGSPEATVVSWPCPVAGEQLALQCGAARVQGAGRRVLVVPALLDEGNKLRRFTVEVMRRLAGAGHACFMPELPGLGESTAQLCAQTPQSWQASMAGAAEYFAASHVLTLRGGALVAPGHLPGWHYAPVAGSSQLRQLLRARIMAAREAGQTETQDSLLALGREQGLELAGYRLGAEFITQFSGLALPEAGGPQHTIAQGMVGGPGLWLRAEPAHSAPQADALAAIVAMALGEAA